MSTFRTWTIYERPREAPACFVVRAYFIRRGDPEPRPSPFQRYARNLYLARKLVPRGLHRFPRAEGDDHSIVETWL